MTLESRSGGWQIFRRLNRRAHCFAADREHVRSGVSLESVPFLSISFPIDRNPFLSAGELRNRPRHVWNQVRKPRAMGYAPTSSFFSLGSYSTM